MGRKIAKRIRGMNWMAKVSLILIFTLVLSTFMYQGWYKPKQSEAAPIAQYSGGLLVYSDTVTVGTPKYKTFDDTTGFGAEQNAASVGTGAIEWIRVAASPTKDEWIIATRDAGDVIKAQVCTGVDGGVSCGAATTITATAGTLGWRNFDVAYEQSSGDALLVYGTATADELRKIEWTGGLWTNDAAITTTRTTGTVEWVELTSRKSSDQIGIAYSDSNDDISAYRWNGTAAADEATAVITATGVTSDVRKFDVAFEGLSGDMLVIAQVTAAGTWASGQLVGTTWTIGTQTGVDNIGAFIDIADGDSSTDDLAIVSSFTNVYEGAEWSGTAIVDGTIAVDITTGTWAANYHWAVASFVSAIYTGVNVFEDTTGTDDISWATMDSAGVYTLRADNVRARGVSRVLELYDYPAADKVILFTEDANSDLWADTWAGAAVDATAWTDLTSGGALEISLTSATRQQFDFAFRLSDITPPVAGTVTVSPDGNGYTSSAPTITTAFTDNETAVTSCEYTTNGSAWNAGVLSGTKPNYTCTANPTGLSGALTINMRATSGGGLTTATAINRTVDTTAPTDGALTAIGGNGQVGLSWTATDAGIGQNTYKLVRATGATPPADCSGAAIYQGTRIGYGDSSVVNGTQYAYRVCATDAAGNGPTAGSTATATPSAGAGKIASCSQCHDYPLVDGTSRNTPEGAVIGDHQKHQFICSTCHVTPATESSADFGHRDANIKLKPDATGISSGYYDKNNNDAYDAGTDDTWLQTNSPATSVCRNISCHGGAAVTTTQWGVGTLGCLGCHNVAIGSRRAMSTEFTTFTWSHKKTAAAWTSNDCGVCHMEGDPATGATTAYHMNNVLEFRDPDTGLTIKGVNWDGLTPGSYTPTVTDATATTFARNTGSNTLEAFAQAVQVNLCLKCHDSDASAGVGNGGAKSSLAWVPGGTALKPFGTAGGTVLDMNAHFATGNASYHPVSGRQNNSYADANTMVTPWNTAGSPGGTKTTKTSLTNWGWLITCWDCHDSSAASRTIGGANASVTHGNAVTLRATYGPGVSGTATQLCVVCHKSSVYWVSGANVFTHVPNLDVSGLDADAATPNEWANGSYHDATNGEFFGCTVCHGTTTSNGVMSGRATAPTDTDYNGLNSHGFDTRSDGTSTTWGSGARPWSFLRFGGSNLDDWDNSPATCGGATDMCGQSGETDTYIPGGTY